MGSLGAYPPSDEESFVTTFQKSLQSLLSQVDTNRGTLSVHATSGFTFESNGFRNQCPTQTNPVDSMADLIKACGLPPILTQDIPISAYPNAKTFSALTSKLFGAPTADSFPQIAACDQNVFEFFMSIRATLADGSLKSLFETIRNPYVYSRYTGPSPVVSFAVPGLKDYKLIGWATNKAQIVEDVKFDIDVVAKMIEKIDSGQNNPTKYTSRNLNQNQIDLNINENSFVVKHYVQELVVWGQSLSSLHKKLETYSLNARKNGSTERLKKISDKGSKSDHADIVTKFHYKRKIKEVKAELNKIRCKLWLILKGSPNSLRRVSARQIYIGILDYLGVPQSLHNSTNDKYMSPLKTIKHVVRIYFSPLPNTDISEMIEGLGEGKNETEAAEESFKALVQTVCNRYIDFLERHESENPTQADSINAALFKQTKTDKPDVMRSDSYIDLISAVRAVSKSLKENHHHIRLENMFEDLEAKWASTTCSHDCNHVQVKVKEQEKEKLNKPATLNSLPKAADTISTGRQTPVVLMPRNRYMPVPVPGSGNPVIQPVHSITARTPTSSFMPFPQSGEFYQRSSLLGKSTFRSSNGISNSHNYFQTQSQTYSPSTFRARRRGDYQNNVEIPPRFNPSLQNGQHIYVPSIVQFHRSVPRTNFGACHPQPSNNSQWLSWNDLSGRRQIFPHGFNYCSSLNGRA